MLRTSARPKSSPNNSRAKPARRQPPRPAETVRRWRVAVEGYGRDGIGPGPSWPVSTFEIDLPLGATRADLREKIERESREDRAGYRAGD